MFIFTFCKLLFDQPKKLIYAIILQHPIALCRTDFLVYLFRLLAALVVVHSSSLYCKYTLCALVYGHYHVYQSDLQYESYVSIAIAADSFLF
jgi:hypothetical protein